jgi:outer membrane immunogenic protein
MRHVGIAACAAILSLAQPAFCADVQTNVPSEAAAVAPIPPFSWTGCHIGAQGGGAWGRDEFVNLTATERVTVGIKGGFGGGQLGCDYQLPLHLLIGVEGEGVGSDIKGSLRRILSSGSATSDQSFTVKTHWLATVTGRVGYDWNRWLLYVKGGAAWARFESEVHIVNCIFFSGSGGCATIQDTDAAKTASGWTIGTGLEWVFWRTWSARLEYDFYDFGRRITVGTAATGPIPVDLERNIHTVRLGVNWRFWPWIAPVSPLAVKD